MGEVITFTSGKAALAKRQPQLTLAQDFHC